VKCGESVSLVLRESDPEGVRLAVIWYEGGRELGRGKNLTLSSFEPGIHIVKGVVSDGEYSINATVVFEIRPVAAETPGPTLLTGCAVLVIAAAARRWFR